MRGTLAAALTLAALSAGEWRIVAGAQLGSEAPARWPPHTDGLDTCLWECEDACTEACDDACWDAWDCLDECRDRCDERCADLCEDACCESR